MKAKKCDRCGKFYEPYRKTGKYSDGMSKTLYCIKFNSVSTFIDGERMEDFDLCEDCATKFYNWLNNK